MKIKLDRSLQTDDLCLATLLAMHGYEATMEVRPKGATNRVEWVVEEPDVDDSLRKFIDEYRHNQVRVEPRQFMYAVRRVRQAMYDKLGMNVGPTTRIAEGTNE